MVTMTLIFFLTWLPIGIIFMEAKINLWKKLLICDKRIFRIHRVEWNKKELMLLFLLWPSQTSRLLGSWKNSIKIQAIPIIPIKLDTSKSYRETINISLSFAERKEIINEWATTIACLGWLNLVMYFIDFVLAGVTIVAIVILSRIDNRQSKK